MFQIEILHFFRRDSLTTFRVFIFIYKYGFPEKSTKESIVVRELEISTLLFSVLLKESLKQNLILYRKYSIQK